MNFRDALVGLLWVPCVSERVFPCGFGSCFLSQGVPIGRPKSSKSCPMSCVVLLFPRVLTCRALSCPGPYFAVLYCQVLSCPGLSSPVLSCLVLSCPVLFCSFLVEIAARGTPSPLHSEIGSGTIVHNSWKNVSLMGANIHY